MKNRKQNFTLIEMLLVIGLIVLVAGMVGINVRRALLEQRFRTEVALITDTLSLAQDLMLILGTDTNVTFTQEKEGIKYQIHVESGLSKNWRKIIEKPAKKLNSIHSVLFQDELDYPTNPGEIVIRFLSGGSVMSRGVLRLSTHEDPENAGLNRRAICLFGFPHSIITSMDDDKACLDVGVKEYDEQVTIETAEEIQRKEINEPNL